MTRDDTRIGLVDICRSSAAFLGIVCPKCAQELGSSKASRRARRGKCWADEALRPLSLLEGLEEVGFSSTGSIGGGFGSSHAVGGMGRRGDGDRPRWVTFPSKRWWLRSDESHDEGT